MACVFVELGTDVHIDGSFEAAIHEGVRRGYTDGYPVSYTHLDVYKRQAPRLPPSGAGWRP